jgi:hypothetical protein
MTKNDLNTDADGYAIPSLDVARARIGRLLGVFQIEAGLTKTSAGHIARGNDPKFARTYLEKDFGFRSYDTVNSRLSAIWPPSLAWPDDVPRQRPADISADDLALLRSRMEPVKKRADEDLDALKVSGADAEKIAAHPSYRLSQIAAELIEISSATA